MILYYILLLTITQTARIYEKVAGRAGKVEQTILPSTSATGNAGTNSAKLTQNGFTDRIYNLQDKFYTLINAAGAATGNYQGISTVDPSPVDFINHQGSGTACSIGLKLVSGLLQNKRYLPLLALKGAGLTLELTLADVKIPFCANKHAGDATEVAALDLTSYTVENVEYVAQTVNFDEAFTSTFMSMIQANGLIQFHGVSYNSFVWTWTYSNSATEVIPIAMRARSLKAILVAMRDNSIISTSNAWSISRRGSFNLSQYVFSIGGVRLPQAPVSIDSTREGLTEAYAEVVKAFASFNDLQYAGRVGVGQYYDQGFAIGIDTEAYSQDSSLLESGMDTASQSLPVRLELTFKDGNIFAARASAAAAANVDKIATIASSGTCRADIYGMVDVIYSVTSDGLMTASD